MQALDELAALEWQFRTSVVSWPSEESRHVMSMVAFYAASPERLPAGRFPLPAGWTSLSTNRWAWSV